MLIAVMCCFGENADLSGKTTPATLLSDKNFVEMYNAVIVRMSKMNVQWLTENKEALSKASNQFSKTTVLHALGYASTDELQKYERFLEEKEALLKEKYPEFHVADQRKVLVHDALLLGVESKVLIAPKKTAKFQRDCEGDWLVNINICNLILLGNTSDPDVPDAWMACMTLMDSVYLWCVITNG
jgi:hypothetical protein